jgi:type III secretory pathway lipoprotein EscJ
MLAKKYKNKYKELKNRQLFYNSQLLLNKNKNKIKTTYAIRKEIAVDKNKINANILKDNSYLIIDPNSNVIMQYNESANLKHIISDIKRLLQYARF